MEDDGRPLNLAMPKLVLVAMVFDVLPGSSCPTVGRNGRTERRSIAYFAVPQNISAATLAQNRQSQGE